MTTTTKIRETSLKWWKWGWKLEIFSWRDKNWRKCEWWKWQWRKLNRYTCRTIHHSSIH